MLLLRGQEIQTFERQLDFPAIIRSSEPSVQFLKKQDYDSLFDYASACALNYLNICYPNQIHLAPVIASDLIETRPSWKAADFINLFKFLRQRQDIEALRVMGNQITIPKFMEMVTVYEFYRAEEVEKLRAEEKGKKIDAKLEGISESILEKFAKKEKEMSGKIPGYDEFLAEKERTGRPQQPKAIPDEDYFLKKNA